jgi:Phd_YefM.
MPQIIPIKDLKNTANISELCEKSNEPIFVTKNGYGEMVIMSMETFEETMGLMYEAKLVNESLEDKANGVEPIEGKKFFEDIRKKYGPKV